MSRWIRGVLTLVVVAGCSAATKAVVTSVPFQARTDFASKVKRIRLRVIELGALFSNSPAQAAERQRSGSTYVPDPVSSHHAAALNTAVRVLQAKGYEVTVVWDDPFSYGSDRPCIGPKPDDHRCTLEESEAGRCMKPAWYQQCERERGKGYRGFIIQIGSYAGSLAADEAFLELTTVASLRTETETRTTPTETEVGRVTDEGGNTVGRVYATGEETQTTTTEHSYAAATAQIFVAGQPRAVFDNQAWSLESTNIVYPTEAVLAAIPARAP